MMADGYNIIIITFLCLVAPIYKQVVSPSILTPIFLIIINAFI